MKTLKYAIIAVVLLSGLTSCLVVDRPGHYHPRHHHHHYHGHRHHR